VWAQKEKKERLRVCYEAVLYERMIPRGQGRGKKKREAVGHLGIAASSQNTLSGMKHKKKKKGERYSQQRPGPRRGGKGGKKKKKGRGSAAGSSTRPDSPREEEKKGEKRGRLYFTPVISKAGGGERKKNKKKKNYTSRSHVGILQPKQKKRSISLPVLAKREKEKKRCVYNQYRSAYPPGAVPPSRKEKRKKEGAAASTLFLLCQCGVPVQPGPRGGKK